MRLRAVLSEAFSLLRQRPVIFLPRLIMTGIWSFFWIKLLQGATVPGSYTLTQLRWFGLFMLVMTPLQIWVYNSYFIIVQQYHDTGVELVTAFRKGAGRLAAGMGAFLIGFTFSLLAALPGMLLAGYGIAAGSIALLGIGILLVALALILTTAALYLVPAAVVLGDNGFLADFRNGLSSTQQERRDVLALTLLSFSLLIISLALEGRLKALGTIGFILGRGVSAVVSVYLLIVNPEMLLQTDE